MKNDSSFKEELGMKRTMAIAVVLAVSASLMLFVSTGIAEGLARPPEHAGKSASVSAPFEPNRDECQDRRRRQC